MIIVLKQNITQKETEHLTTFLNDRGYKVRRIVGETETVIGAVGSASVDVREVEILPGVDRVIPISKPYKLASREFHPMDTVISVGPVKIGGSRIVIMAGPCAIESREQILKTAWAVKEAGGVMLRGGAFKPRTSPYAFQGLGFEGLEYLKAAGEETGLPVVSEIVSPKDVKVMSDLVDVFQIGTRNMQNFELLKAVGDSGMPVILKRGMAATIEEWLMAAEYLLSSGTDKVILCERGIRTFEPHTRNTLDISAIPVIRELSHLPVIIDPSHATGIRDKVPPLALAGVAAGAHGLIIEVHTNPDEALSDGAQTLWPAQFEKLLRDIEVLSHTVGKALARLPEKHQQEVLQAHLAGTETEQGSRAAFQGERGAYSEKAIRNYFPEDEVEPIPLPRFKDIFTCVLKRQASWGMIPLENSLTGSIHENYDLLSLHPDVKIVGEIKIRITHNLIATGESSLDSVKTVYSHPQALSQCTEYIEARGWHTVPFYDTAGAAAEIAEKRDPALAAIASAEAARHYGLTILEECIETDPRNYTRFTVIAPADTAIPEEVDKASLLFALPDKPGSLSSCLAVFARHGINMTKLESRPILGKPWSYLFYVDVMLPEDPEDFRKAEEQIRENTEGYRNLGVYRAC